MKRSARSALFDPMQPRDFSTKRLSERTSVKGVRFRKPRLSPSYAYREHKRQPYRTSSTSGECRCAGVGRGARERRHRQQRHLARNDEPFAPEVALDFVESFLRGLARLGRCAEGRERVERVERLAAHAGAAGARRVPRLPYVGGLPLALARGLAERPARERIATLTRAAVRVLRGVGVRVVRVGARIAARIELGRP